VSQEPKAPRSQQGASLALETEPLVFFHPTLVGLVAPGAVQPVPATLLLEEEPVTWPQLDQ
jgi:hypothetical protein